MTAVAIYTDASIHHGEAAWAAVYVREGEAMVETAGRLRGLFLSSTAVEGAAMANALWHARREGLVEPGDLVTLRSDNQAIVQRVDAMLRGRAFRTPKDEVIATAARRVMDEANIAGIRLSVVWIKGHQRLKSRDPHALYNRRCDQLCSAARRGTVPPTWASLVALHAAYQRRRDKAEGRAA